MENENNQGENIYQTPTQEIKYGSEEKMENMFTEEPINMTTPGGDNNNKKKSNKLFIIAPIVVVALIVAVLAFNVKTLAAKFFPDKYLLYAIGETNKAIEKRSEDTMMGTMVNLAELMMQGTTEVEVSDISFGGQDLLEGMSIKGKLASDSKNNKCLIDGSLQADGQTIDASLYVAKGEIAGAMPTVLGDGTYYGIKLENVKDQLEKSIFKPNSGSSLELDSESYNGIVDAMTELEKKLKNPRADLSEQYIKELEEIFKEITESKKAVSRTAKVEVDGETVNATEIKYSYNEKETKELYKKIITDFMKTEYYKSIKAVSESTDYDATFMQILDMMENINAKMDVIFYVNEDNHIMQTVYVLDGLEEIGRFEIKISYGRNVIKDNLVMVELLTSVGNITFESRVLDPGKNYKSEMKVAVKDSYSEVQMKLTTDWDKTSGAYKTVINTNGLSGDLELKGILKSEKEKLFTFTVDSIGSGDEVITTNVKLNSTRDCNITTPEYKNILQLTEDEMYEIVSSAMGSMY